MTRSEVRYDLDVQTYEFLRELSPARCLLVVLVLPEDETTWLTQSAEELVVRHCAYWHSLRGAAATTATSSVRIAIPQSQIFAVQALREMFERMSKGGEP